MQAELPIGEVRLLNVSLICPDDDHIENLRYQALCCQFFGVISTSEYKARIKKRKAGREKEESIF